MYIKYRMPLFEKRTLDITNPKMTIYLNLEQK